MDKTPPQQLLPVELYSHIFAFVEDDQDLCRLSLVSRLFYQESTPPLYHTVDLSIRENRIYYFGPTIRDNPGLALHVRVMTLTLWYFSMSVLEDLVGDILAATHNLRVLTIDSSPRDFKDFAGITRNCQFRLYTFHNHAIDLTDHLRFLEAQPNITNWTLTVPHQDRSVHLLDTHLPNVVTMSVDATVLRAFTTPRPVKQLSIFYDYDYSDEGPELEHSIPLEVFRETLVTFSWDRTLSYSDVGGPVAIASIADQAPYLKHLFLIDLPGDSDEPVDHQSFHVLLRPLSLFKDLETFAYAPAKDDTDSFWWNVCSLEGPPKVAEALFAAQPTLHLVTFQTCDSENLDSTLHEVCYSRSPDGEVREEPASTLTFDSWRELW
ncbi:hypothetical protein JAAARDRAFT_39053 [Jaapia argillacea MUCL 33604]|uniref:F-box domain-containing protein n=1 Tax=Jaapia argillacea MUCL 33604 TaxID=933084 RepID=A0A067PTS6_9AGAM|nr:hypothetical protein JAAARDRAFT_39053 [Jaapia argillacea MUCL 33604]